MLSTDEPQTPARNPSRAAVRSVLLLTWRARPGSRPGGFRPDHKQSDGQGLRALIPARDPKATPAQIDLAPFYTDSFGIRLSHLSVPNPRPDVAVKSIDFILGYSQSMPFLVGLTIEPTEPLD